MNQLTIDDLNFCESALSSESEVRGGFDVSAGYSSSFDTDQSSSFIAFVDPSSLRYLVAGDASGAAAGAAAGAIAVNGVIFTATGTSASAF